MHSKYVFDFTPQPDPRPTRFKLQTSELSLDTQQRDFASYGGPMDFLQLRYSSPIKPGLLYPLGHFLYFHIPSFFEFVLVPALVLMWATEQEYHFPMRGGRMTHCSYILFFKGSSCIQTSIVAHPQL